MGVREECKSGKSDQETSGIIVDIQKLSTGLKTTFEKQHLRGFLRYLIA